MRRIAFALILLAAIVGLHACAADAPTNPGPGPARPRQRALQIQLVTSDANPAVGHLHADPGDGDPERRQRAGRARASTSRRTSARSARTGFRSSPSSRTGGVAVTAAVRRRPPARPESAATATIGGNPARPSSRSRSSPATTPFRFVSSCSPSFGPKEGGTVLTLNGGRFFGYRVDDRCPVHGQGRHARTARPSVTQSQIVVLTPGFPEFVVAGASDSDHGDTRHQPGAPDRAVAAGLLRLRHPGCGHAADRIAPAVLGHERRRDARDDRGLGLLGGRRRPGLLRPARGHRRLGLLQPGRRPLAGSRSAAPTPVVGDRARTSPAERSRTASLPPTPSP